MEIILYDSKNNEKSRAKVDSECVSLVIGVKWYQRPDGYVATNNYRGNGYTYLHAVILGKLSDKSVYIDHKNSNRQRFWKRYSNRAVRRGVQAGSGKSGYKRCFDYWWEID